MNPIPMTLETFFGFDNLFNYSLPHVCFVPDMYIPIALMPLIRALGERAFAFNCTMKVTLGNDLKNFLRIKIIQEINMYIEIFCTYRIICACDPHF